MKKKIFIILVIVILVFLGYLLFKNIKSRNSKINNELVNDKYESMYNDIRQIW